MLKKIIKPLGLLFLLLALALTIIAVGRQHGALTSSSQHPGMILAIFIIIIIIGVLILLCSVVTFSSRWHTPIKPQQDDETSLPVIHAVIDVKALKHHLQHRDRLRWKRALPWLLVMGETSDVEQVAPELIAQGWLQVGNVLLLWGGSLTTGGNTADLQALRRLRRHRPVDALIWVSNESQYAQPSYADAALRGYEQVRYILRWQAPVYLLDLREPSWPQPERPLQLVGVIQDKRLTPESLLSGVQSLFPQLREQGMAQINLNIRHEFLLRLASELQRGVNNWVAAFTPLLAGYQSLPLYGVVFSPPLNPIAFTAHQRAESPVWRGLASNIHHRAGRAVGITPLAVAQWSAAAMLLIITLGSVVAWASNYRLVIHSAALVQQATDQPSPQVLTALQQNIQTLLAQQQHGTPLYRRFGMDQTPTLLPVLWPAYAQLAQRLIVQPVQQQLGNALSSNPPSYHALKTYLLLAHPDQANDRDTRLFFVQQLQALLPQITATDITFFATQFPQHPDWRISANNMRVAQARRALLQNMSGPEAEARLYHALLDRASRNYGNLSLLQLLDGQDASEMFALDTEVPGRFTRQAYEGAVLPDITALVAQRQEQVGWVLAESGQSVEISLSPQALGERLTARYFSDYGTAWQKTLNQLTAQTTKHTDKQLALAADVNRSPQVALMKQLAWQGLAGSPNPRQSQVNPALQPVFGGVVAMVFGQNTEKGITLAAWRSQASRLRDRISNLSAATGGTAALSQSVFRGSQIDNSIAELPARLTAQLGNGWQPMTHALFLAPLSQTWKGVMTSGVSRMETQWQQEIVAPWHQAFDHSFPFTDSRQDASLATLSDFINPQTGQIPRFISQYLNGVLVYSNDHWQLADKLPPGLTVSPLLIKKLNQLDTLGRTITGNGWGVRFQLQAGTARDVVQTQLRIDGQQLTYFNQMPFWQDIQWPGDTYSPGASLTWNSVQAGARLYFAAPGTWAFYRLLKKATITPLDSTHYQLTWKADDGLPLNYRLAFTAGHDPISLLQLSEFQLPNTLFR